MPEDNLSPLLAQALGNLQFELLKLMAEKQRLTDVVLHLQQELAAVKKDTVPAE
ncbi:hypothetical protein [Azospirillum soli]|uniref:hypothetical protein n=1 Tax=Azospirillum soli TaxID=1304799 RepID=UPI001AEA1739|nr:hypothetical protein [Azospirillum soli]MBP2313351.1 hypothetical protein [Azospirillum soli]